MRTLYSFATICVFGALSALLPACGSSDDSKPSGAAGSGNTAGSSAAGSGNTAGSAPVGDATKGSAVYQSQVCGSCHGGDAEGGNGPNITMSKTAGIGNWTYQQFHDAVRKAVDEDGKPLCALMASYAESDISEASMADLYAFIKSKPVNDTVNKGTYVTSGVCK